MAVAAEKSVKKGPGSVGKLYLFLYNAVQTLGWGYLLLQILSFYATGRYKNERLWDVTKTTVIIFQNLAVLEVVHVILGLVRSSIFMTATQVWSRVMVVCLILVAVPASQDSPGVPLAFLCWSITEVIRYSFYALSLFDAVPYFLIWCRYTFFIVLYPFGVSGELLCLYAAQEYVGQTKLYCLELPNVLNATFNYRYFLILNAIGYLPGFPQLYMYMFSQRKKIIGSPVQKKSKKTE